MLQISDGLPRTIVIVPMDSYPHGTEERDVQ